MTSVYSSFCFKLKKMADPDVEWSNDNVRRDAGRGVSLE